MYVDQINFVVCIVRLLCFCMYVCMYVCMQ